jgi:hypothetical protein
MCCDLRWWGTLISMRRPLISLRTVRSRIVLAQDDAESEDKCEPKTQSAAGLCSGVSDKERAFSRV